MTISQLIARRLTNQQIIKTKFRKPEELVSYMCAVQAQDFGMAKWAIGLRLKNLHESDVEKAFNAGKILRTHVMRPTWHFVTPKDIKWLLELTAPRVNTASASIYRKLELDSKTFRRSSKVIAKAFNNEKYLTRSKLKLALGKEKINTEGLRLGFFLFRAELDGIICSGPREGKQFTYALLDQRAPAAVKLSREESLAEAAKKYFTSRGPATIQDFVWWSGLTTKDAREGLELVKNKFISETIAEQKYYFKDTRTPKIKSNHNATFLMPDYDEYVISYKDRSAIFRKMNFNLKDMRENPVFNHIIIINGIAGGIWHRKVKGNIVKVETSLSSPLNKTKYKKIAGVVKIYFNFLGQSQ